ncbi:cleavage and polyadenylation specificity factor subunit 6 isoform X1 [Engystomops pustulosus]|uniref:cleavage and polyadenylation specificity factor subunit 6 isoform X1 n=1 Tax=Engystomops pustulosus TaxID=76066 RepID=UPI003AFA643B
MADGVDHIDIYADVGEEFNQEAEYGAHEQIELYEDVISPSANNGDAPEDRDYMDNLATSVSDDVVKGSAPNVVFTYPGKRIALYIGNLTWWTTDDDLTDAVHSLGVNDILEIKFYENRANGQSKGFALICVGSESSSKKLMDLLPKRELHGQNPAVTPCNKQFLSQFEMQSKKTATQAGQMSGEGKAGPPGINARLPFPPGGRGRGRFPTSGPGGDRFPGPTGPGGPPPPFAGMAPPRPPMCPPGPPGPPGPPPPGQPLPPPLTGPPNRGERPPPPVLFPGQPYGQPPLVPLPPGPPPPVYGPPPGPPPPQQGPPPPPGPFPPRPPGPPMALGPPPHLTGPPPGGPPPAPHVNPNFFPPPGNAGMPASDSRGPPSSDPYGRPPPYDRVDYGPPGRDMDSVRTPLSEAEFEEIMNRNRAISSSAISRAVSDASAGDYGSAIETLVTAISLIKQSKVSADDRCKVLISSLQDCLHGIESKSYGSGSRRRERSRERDHSRSREKSRRHKSRSRDRHDDYYRERSRERERHRDRDRDRDRERDREREYRHR